jgi:hypothetical protein
VGLRAASGNGDGSWLELGFQCACKELREREMGSGVPRVSTVVDNIL